MKLTELLDTKVQGKAHPGNDQDTYSMNAKIGKRYIHFYASKYGDEWTVQFQESDNDGDFGGIYKVTNSGDELKVFAFVKDCILHLIKKYDPVVIDFSAEKDYDDKEKNTRGDLYARLLKRFTVPGYTVSRNTDSKSGIDNFKLLRKGL